MKIKSDIYPAWMVEIAYGYAKIADMAWRDGNLGVQSEINAALAVEILLKSLSAEPVENVRLRPVDIYRRAILSAARLIIAR
ncbi:hypothetical protein [Novosphingobium sp. 17-62-19]|uniref:hypothetical protein n=1 Tax=Novosphingobium sp. 17-62-19 TaxID=1970406 RepID=UPI0025E88159|nr:hypothetical protein [Novosphingobium sp. 17-62-19]